jgi:hypothetical protein
MLLTFIAHLFVNKLRLSYGVMTTTPGPAPVVDKPVDTQEYTEAVLSLQNNQEIKHRKIHAYPRTPQFVVTIGMVMKILSFAFVKIGHCLEYVDH